MGRKSRRKKYKQTTSSATSYAESKPNKQASVAGNGFALILIEIIRWGAYVALFAPLVVHPSFFFPFVVPKTVFFWIFTEIIFGAWVLLALPNKQFRPQWNPISVALGVFLFVTIFTSFTGVNLERSFWSTLERMAGTVHWIHLVIFFFVLTSTFRTFKDWKGFLSASMIASSLVAAIFLLDRVGVSMISFNTQAGSTIGNSSFMAAYLLFNVFLGSFLLVKSKGDWQRILYGIGLGLIVLTILFSYSYGVLVSMFGGIFIILIAWLFFERKIKFARELAVLLLVGGVILAGIISFGTFMQNEAILSKLPYFFSNEGTIGARRVVWDMAWQGIKERPILGWGPENFNVPFAKYFNPCLVMSKCGGEIWFDRTHNIILDNLTHSGIVGLISYISIFIAVLFVLWKKLLQSRKDWFLSAIITAALASYFVQNLLVFDMLNTYLMFSFTLAFAAASAGKEEIIAPRANPKPFSMVMVGLFLMYFLFSFGFQSYQAANWGVVISRSSTGLNEKIELYKKALSATPLGNRQIPEFFTNQVVNWAQDNEDIPASFIVEVEAIMRKITEENPFDFRHHLILGNFYNAAKKFDVSYVDKAEEILTKAIDLSPQNPQVYTSLGQTYLFKNDKDKAFSLLQKAVDLEPEYTKSSLNLAESYVMMGEYEKGKDAFEKLFSENKFPLTTYYISRLIFAYDQLKEYDKAIAWSKEITESKDGQTSAAAHFQLAELYKKAGFITEARETALKAKSFDPSPDVKKQIDELLKEL